MSLSVDVDAPPWQWHGPAAWSTSLFPDSDSGYYFLPIQKAVREAEGMQIDRKARIHREIVDARP